MAGEIYRTGMSTRIGSWPEPLCITLDASTLKKASLPELIDREASSKVAPVVFSLAMTSNLISV